MEFPDFYVKGPTPCSQKDPDMFLPEPDDPHHADLIREAKKVCRGCPYRAECLAWALENNEPGVWGGTSERDRKKMKRSELFEARKSRELLYL